MPYECNIVVDFEFNPVATGNRDIIRNEIIEIGAIKLNRQFEEIGRFSCYVRPELNNHIDSSITKLTGIRDKDVLEAADFSAAVELFSRWAGPAKCRVFSWSDNDFRQLDDECYVKNVNFPSNMYRWIDFQKIWQRLIDYPHNLCMSLKYAASQASIELDDTKSHHALYDSEITTELLRLAVSKEYMHTIKQAKTRVVSHVSSEGYSIGSVCGDKLLAFLSTLQTA